MRIGIDVGGTKIEGIVLGEGGLELARLRLATPQGDYEGTLETVRRIVEELEARTGAAASVGVGIPGTVQANGLVKNSNSLCLNGRALERDLSARLGREIRCANDANCFAMSEATDGAARGYGVVFGVIVGTGCGGGLVVDGKVKGGRNGLGGEWGHTPLPWANASEYPGPVCYCGHEGCLEMWISGRGLERDHAAATGREWPGKEVVAASEAGDAGAREALERLGDRIGRGLAVIVNVLDPDVIVLGGGVSNIDAIYPLIGAALVRNTFGGGTETPVVKALYGDSSGVRGAAWLWPAE